MSLFDDLAARFTNRPGFSQDALPDAQLAAWPLSSVVADICLRSGVPFDRINLEDLEGQLYGLVHNPSDEAYKSIEAMSQIFQFDVSSYDGQLHFPTRGAPVSAALTLDDLVDDSGDPVKRSERKDPITVPKVLHLEYYDIEGGLSPDTQTSDRSLDSRAVAETKVSTTVRMTSEDAAKAAVIAHKVSIEEQRGEVEFSLPDSWLWLVPGDIVTLENDRLRLTEVEIDEGFQNYKAVFDRASAYQTNATGVPVPAPIDPPSLILGDTVLHFIDSHIIADRDDRLGYYVVVGRASDQWLGAVVELSTDGGENFTESLDVETEGTFGTLVEALPSASVSTPDFAQTARVRLVLDDVLEPATFTEVMNRKNLALVGNELVNFMDAEQVGDKEWLLTGFLRGRKGSPIAAHPAGTRFVMLDRQLVFFIEADVFDLGQPLTFRATTAGTAVSVTKTVTLTGQSQTERQPAYLAAVRSGGNIAITWQGVGRLGGSGAVGMGAFFTGYQVTVNGVAQPVQPAESLTITDPGGSVAIQVSQINQLTGAGPAATVTI